MGPSCLILHKVTVCMPLALHRPQPQSTGPAPTSLLSAVTAGTNLVFLFLLDLPQVGFLLSLLVRQVASPRSHPISTHHITQHRELLHLFLSAITR